MLNERQLFEEIGKVDDDLIAQAEQARGTRRRAIRWLAAAACLALLLAAGIPAARRQSRAIGLPSAEGNARAWYADRLPADAARSAACLADLTEPELLAQADTIFRGTVLSVRNVEIDFNGSTDYRAVAELRVAEPLRGAAAAGETVTALLPCPVDGEIWMEDTETASQMRRGVEGIFLLRTNDGDVFRSENGATVYWKDLAQYGFWDGSRFAFLAAEDGLLYADWAWPSLTGAQTLDEVAAWLRDADAPNGP